MNSRGKEFLERLQTQILVGDGAFGTRLYEKGFDLDVSYEGLNLSHPQIVEEVLAEYVAAGADVIETNTFCANRLKQKRFVMDDRVSEMSHAAAKIARKVAGSNVYVAGSIGPLVRQRRDLDEFSEDETRALFREPMQALVDGGVDVLYLETFTYLFELETALEVALEFGVPVICQMAFGEEGTTYAGVTAERSAKSLMEKGANVIGANCRSGPHILRDVIERQSRVTDLPIAVYPNAGYAQQIDGRFIYQASSKYFGEKAPELIAAGATLIGGCCGTSVEHVREIAAAVKGARPAPRARISVSATKEPSITAPQQVASRFLALFDRAEPFVTVEIDPPRDLNLRTAFDGARAVTESGADALNVPDNALAVSRMDNVIFADLLRQKVDLPVILHLTCRDKNMIALQSQILGAEVVGIEAILAVTGDPAAIGDQPGASSVYDVKSIGLIDMISTMNRGVTPTGRALETPTDFAIGVALNPNVTGERGLDAAFMKLQKKVDAGANFIETQPMYDVQILSNFLQAAKKLSIPFCVGLMPIVSFKNAEFFHNEIPGVKIPKEVRDSFRDLDKEAAEAEGIRQAKKLIDVARDNGAKHFYIVPPLKRFHIAVELVKYIKR